METRTKTIIGITIAALLGVGVLTAVLQDEGTQAVPRPQQTTQVPQVQDTSTELLAPDPAGLKVELELSTLTTSETVTQPSQKSRDFSRESRPTAVTSEATTTTSEVPPPLTPEQEAKIQAGLDASDEANPDLNEHMPTGHDFDLPSESSTTVQPQL